MPGERQPASRADQPSPVKDWKDLHDLGKNHDIPSDEGYVYHATNADRAHEIADSKTLDTHKPSYGTDQDMWPDGATDKRSYFTKNASHAWQFAPEEGQSVLMRMKEDPQIHKVESGTGDVYAKKPILSKNLEVLGADKEWHPVNDLADAAPSNEGEKQEESKGRTVSPAKEAPVKGTEAHESFGVHPDDLPRHAKYQDVDFDHPDLQDSAKRVTAESIEKDYVRPKDRGKVSIYQSYIPMEDLPTPKFVSEEEENFDREDYRPKVGSPIKVDIHPNGSVNILDGNHRVKVWGDNDMQYAPAWVIDHRGPNIEHLSEDERAEREEED